MAAGTAKAIVEVHAGLAPGRPEPEFSRRWVLGATDWSDRGVDALTDVNGQAMAYAMYLQLQPNALNWVRLEWVWL